MLSMKKHTPRNGATLLAVFPDRTQADKAVSHIRKKGYEAQDISIIVKEGIVKDEPVTSTATNTVEGMISGATAGGTLGALGGLLIGIGAIAVPGVGVLLIGGPLAAALGLTGAAATAVSAAATGVAAGGLVGGLIGWGLPEETARVYEERVREGAIVLAVSGVSSSDIPTVEDSFSSLGADQIRVVG